MLPNAHMHKPILNTANHIFNKVNISSTTGNF